MLMKRILIALACVLSMFVMTACGAKYTEPVEASQTGFAISFLKNVNAVTPKGENVIVSPYSAAVALSMVAEGAAGQTRVEFDNVLDGVLYKAEDLGGNDTVVVKSANSVWIDDNFSPRNRYVSLLEKDFNAFLDVVVSASKLVLYNVKIIILEEKQLLFFGKRCGILNKLKCDKINV